MACTLCTACLKLDPTCSKEEDGPYSGNLCLSIAKTNLHCHIYRMHEGMAFLTTSHHASSIVLAEKLLLLSFLLFIVVAPVGAGASGVDRGHSRQQ